MHERLPVYSPLFILVALSAAGCGDDGASAADTRSASVRYRALAQARGCAEPADVEIPPRCEVKAIAWIDCVEQDLDQCLCESDGELNCEGSFKPNEGPALCIPEYQELDPCLDTDT